MNTLVLLGCLKAYLKLSAGWCTQTIAQTGKTALIAGASKHPGYEIAENLAGRGARVIIADNDNLDSTRDKIIAKTGNEKVEFKYVDFYKLNTVRKLAQDLKRDEKQLHILVFSDNVSGLDKKPTEDGFLKVVQYNHLAPFLLTYELMDLFKKTPNSRIVFRSNVLAFMHKIYSPQDIIKSPPNRSQLLHDFFEYCNSSVLTLMTMSCFADMLKENRVYCCAAHPGFMDMTLFDISKDLEWNKASLLSSIICGKVIPSFLQFFGKTYVEGAQTAIHAAITPEERDISGKFLADCRMIMQPPSAQMRLFRKTIFEETKRLVVTDDNKSKPPSDIQPSLKTVHGATPPPPMAALPVQQPSWSGTDALKTPQQTLAKTAATMAKSAAKSTVKTLMVPAKFFMTQKRSFQQHSRLYPSDTQAEAQQKRNAKEPNQFTPARSVVLGADHFAKSKKYDAKPHAPMPSSATVIMAAILAARPAKTVVYPKIPLNCPLKMRLAEARQQAEPTVLADDTNPLLRTSPKKKAAANLLGSERK